MPPTASAWSGEGSRARLTNPPGPPYGGGSSSQLFSSRAGELPSAMRDPDPPPEGPNVTELLRAWSAGDAGAFDRLAPAVYDELRRQARRSLRREGAGHTLQP